MSQHQTVHLVDASPYIFRAYFSLPSSMVDRDGRSVGAVYGFLAFLLKLIDEEDPTHLGVAFDASLTTSFRNDIFPDYKAGRELPPPELEAQLEDCRLVAQALGAATYVHRRYEADDLIGTLCRWLESANRHCVIVTSDKDLAQLVSERVTLLDFARRRRYTPQAVAEKFSVRPAQIPDLLGLAGDAVDNIPGVPGIGRKTASALLDAFGRLELLYERLDQVPQLPLRGARSVAAKLARGRQAAFLSKRLATIAVDAPVPADLGRLEWRGADWDRLDPLLDRLGFGRIRTRIPGRAAKTGGSRHHQDRAGSSTTSSSRT